MAPTCCESMTLCAQDLVAGFTSPQALWLIAVTSRCPYNCLINVYSSLPYILPSQKMWKNNELACKWKMSKVKISQMLQLDLSWRSIGCRQHGSTRCRTSLAFSGSFDLQTINQLHEWEKLAKRMIGSFDGDEEADRAQRSFWRHRECMIHYLPSLNVKVFLDEICLKRKNICCFEVVINALVLFP